MELKSLFDRGREDEVLTLAIPYDLKPLKASDTITFAAKFTSKNQEYNAYSKLELPMLESFKFETSSYIKFLRSFFDGIKLGSKLIFFRLPIDF